MNYELSKEEKNIFINNFINQGMNASNNYDELKRKLELNGKIIYWNEKYKVTPLMFLLGFNKGRYNHILKDQEQDYRNIFSPENYDIKIKSRQFFASGNAIKKLKFKNGDFYSCDVFGKNLLHYGSNNDGFKVSYLNYLDNVENNYFDKNDKSYEKKKGDIDYEILESLVNYNEKSHMFYFLVNTNVKIYDLKDYSMDMIRFHNNNYIFLGLIKSDDIKKLTPEEKELVEKKCNEFKEHMKVNEVNLAKIENERKNNFRVLQVLGRPPRIYENETSKMLSILDYLILKLEELPENNLNKNKKMKL